MSHCGGPVDCGAVQLLVHDSTARVALCSAQGIRRWLVHGFESMVLAQILQCVPGGCFLSHHGRCELGISTKRIDI